MSKSPYEFVKRSHLLLILFIVYLINYFTLQLFAIRFDWEEDQAFIVGKSIGIPLMLLVWVFAIPLVVKLKERFPISQKEKRNIVLHIILSVLLSMIVDFIAEVLKISVLYLFESDYYLEYAQTYFNHIDIRVLNLRFFSVATYWLIFVYYSSVDFYKKYKNETLKRAEAESLIAKAELNALKMQIQPHFLFNTLHSISSLIDEDTEEAQDVIGRLGNLLRYTLDEKEDFIPLKKEIGFIENYLEIEKARFKDRLLVIYDIQKESENAYIASFILQPLIENAIKHGLSKTNRECTIVIQSGITDSLLRIEVSDNGNGSTAIEKGIGLDNVVNRLKNYYQDNFEFRYQNIQPNGFKVVMKIPLNLSN